MKTIQEKLADRIYELLPEKKKMFWNVEEEFEPIRLAEVLRVITEKYDPNSEEEGENLNNNIIQIIRGSFGVKGYNFSQDNILDQSDEFCEFVYNLIK